MVSTSTSLTMCRSILKLELKSLDLQFKLLLSMQFLAPPMLPPRLKASSVQTQLFRQRIPSRVLVSIAQEEAFLGLPHKVQFRHQELSEAKIRLLRDLERAMLIID